MPVPTIKGTDYDESLSGTTTSVNPPGAQSGDVVLYIEYVLDSWGPPVGSNGNWTQIDLFNDTDGFSTRAYVATVTASGPYSFTHTGSSAVAHAYGIAMTRIDNVTTLSVGASQSTQRGPAIAPSVNATALNGRLFFIAPDYKALGHGAPPTNAGAVTLIKTIVGDLAEAIQIYDGEMISTGATGSSQNAASGGGGDRFPAMHVWVPPSPSLEVIGPFGSVEPAGELLISVDDVPGDKEGAISPTGTLTLRPSLALEGSIAPAGVPSATQLDTEEVEGSIAPSGELTLMPMVSFSGSVAPVAQLPFRDPTIEPIGSIAPFGQLIRVSINVLDVDGQVIPAGELILTAIREEDGSITPTGEAEIIPQSAYDGSIAPIGTLTLLPDMRLEGNIAPIGTGASIDLQQHSVEGSIEMAGSLELLPIFEKAGSILPFGLLELSATQELAGSIAPTGVVFLLEPVEQLVDGSISPIGEVIFLIPTDDDVLFGRIQPLGTIRLQPSIKLEGAVGPSGGLLVDPTTELAGSIAPSGTVSVIVSLSIQLAGSIGPSGQLDFKPEIPLSGSIGPISQLTFSVPVEFSGQIGPSGTLATTIITGIKLNAVLTVSGEVVLSPQIVLAGSIGPNGDVSMGTNVLFEGSIAPSGTVEFTEPEGLKWRSPKRKDMDREKYKRMQR